VSENDTLEIVREIHAKPETVFKALTNSGDLARWWTGIGGIKQAEIDLRVGGRYRFEFRIGGDASIVMQGEYRIVDPPRRFAMTWISPKHPTLQTLVTFELEPIAGGTRVKITHEGLSDPQAFRDHEQGWLAALTLLISWLAVAGPMFSRSGGGGPEDR